MVYGSAQFYIYNTAIQMTNEQMHKSYLLTQSVIKWPCLKISSTKLPSTNNPQQTNYIHTNRLHFNNKTQYIKQHTTPNKYKKLIEKMQKCRVKESFSSTTDQLKYKIILVGDTAVGKSTLFMKFTEGEAYDQTRNKVTTIDFKMKQVTLPQQIDTVKLFIWDTAGQQRYRSIVSTYFKGCHGVLLVFDLSQRQTFENVQTEWLPLLRKKAEQATIMLVGNKSDLEEKVEEEEVLKFVRENKLHYVKTSVRENTHIDQAFLKLTSMVNSKRHLLERPQSFYLKQKEQKGKKRNCCLFN